MNLNCTGLWIEVLCNWQQCIWHAFSVAAKPVTSLLWIDLCIHVNWLTHFLQIVSNMKQHSSIVSHSKSQGLWLNLNNTHTHTFSGHLSGTTRVSRYQKGKTNLDFTEARDSEWQWNPLCHMQVCTSLQTDNHASTPPLSFDRADALMLPNQQRQSTEVQPS